MKILLLATSLLIATGAVAAPDETASATQIAPAIALSPYDQLTQIARAQFDAEDWKGLQKTMEQALPLATTPQEKSDTLRRLSGALFQQGMNDAGRDAAQKMFALGVASTKDKLETRTQVMSSYFNEQKWEEVRKTSEEILADPLTPDNARWQARFSLGMSYNGLKDNEKARQQLDLVVADENTPAFFRGLSQLTLGESYQKTEQWDEARQNFEAVTKIKDVSGDLLIGAYEGWSEVAQKQGQPKTAEAQFAIARSLLMQKADGRYKAKDWAGAIISYKAALTAGMPDPITELVAHQQIGTALQSQEKYDEARAEYQYILDTELDPSNASQMQMLPLVKPGAYIGIANGYIAQKKFDKARETVNRMLETPNLLAPFRMSAEALLKKLPPKQ